MEKLNTVKETVKEVMNRDPKTRNSDKWLILQVLRKMGYKIYVDYDELKEMPSFESITRSRRYWQNTMKELQPTEETYELRSKLINEYINTFMETFG